MTNLRIGIDLDNTILDYAALFLKLARRHDWVDPDCSADKLAVKQALRERAGDAEDAELRWQRLQALAYGEAIDDATLFAGFEDFVRAARIQGHTLVIVSHKTEFSNLDPSVALREHARRTLHQRGFFDPDILGFRESDVYFESTLREKVDRITHLELTHFIDDLGKVFERHDFPFETQPLLFGSTSQDVPFFSDWPRLVAFLDWAGELHSLGRGRLVAIDTLKHGGNNQVLGLSFIDGTRAVVKTYMVDPEDDRPRLKAEWNFLRQLENHGLGYVARPLRLARNSIITSALPGSPPTGPLNPQLHYQIIEFLLSLDRLSTSLPVEAAAPAANARFCLRHFARDLLERRTAIRLACQTAMEPQAIAVSRFLETSVDPLIDAALHQFDAHCRSLDLDPDEPLPEAQYFLSPSDFGPHNSLYDDSGRLHFLDFEYAGWDDPTKLLCDFSHHVGFEMDMQHRQAIIDEFVANREDDARLVRRIFAVRDLVALEWVLIVLNVVVPRELRRKTFADPDLDAGDLIAQRLIRAREMLDRLSAEERL